MRCSSLVVLLLVALVDRTSAAFTGYTGDFKDSPGADMDYCFPNVVSQFSLMYGVDPVILAEDPGGRCNKHPECADKIFCDDCQANALCPTGPTEGNLHPCCSCPTDEEAVNWGRWLNPCSDDPANRDGSFTCQRARYEHVPDSSTSEYQFSPYISFPSDTIAKTCTQDIECQYCLSGGGVHGSTSMLTVTSLESAASTAVAKPVSEVQQGDYVLVLDNDLKPRPSEVLGFTVRPVGEKCGSMQRHYVKITVKQSDGSNSTLITTVLHYLEVTFSDGGDMFDPEVRALLGPTLDDASVVCPATLLHIMCYPVAGCATIKAFDSSTNTLEDLEIVDITRGYDDSCNVHVPFVSTGSHFVLSGGIMLPIDGELFVDLAGDGKVTVVPRFLSWGAVSYFQSAVANLQSKMPKAAFDSFIEWQFETDAATGEPQLVGGLVSWIQSMGITNFANISAETPWADITANFDICTGTLCSDSTGKVINTALDFVRTLAPTLVAIVAADSATPTTATTTGSAATDSAATGSDTTTDSAATGSDTTTGAAATGAVTIVVIVVVVLVLLCIVCVALMVFFWKKRQSKASEVAPEPV